MSKLFTGNYFPGGGSGLNGFRYVIPAPVVTHQQAVKSKGANRVPEIGNRVPDVLGLARIWPDAITPPYEIFDPVGTGQEGHLKKIIAMFILGPGDYSILDTSKLKLANTPLADIATGGLTTTLLDSGDSTDTTLVQDSLLVDSIELEPPDQGGDWTDWFQLPYTNTEEILLDWSLPNGLYKDDGENPSNATATWEYEYRPTGGSTVGPVSVTKTRGNKRKLRYTTHITGLTPDQYEVRVKRSNNRATDDVSDLEWTAFRAISKLAVSSYPVSRLKVELDDMPHEYDLGRVMKFNLEVQRKLLHILGNGAVAVGGVQPTQFITDAIYYLCTDPRYGNRPHANVDTVTLGEIFTELNGYGNDLEYFNGILTGENETVDSALDLVADGARIVVQRLGPDIGFSRDNLRSAVGLFTPRTKAETGQERLVSWASESPADSVLVTWTNKLNNWADETYQYPEPPTTANDPIRKELPGVIYQEQAERIARFIWSDYLNRQDGLILSVTEEAAHLDLFDVVWVVDGLTDQSVDRHGEIVRVQDLGGGVTRLHFDKRIGVNHRLIVRNDEGNDVFEFEDLAGFSGRHIDVTGFSFSEPAADCQTRLVWAVDWYNATLSRWTESVRKWQIIAIEPADLGFTTLQLRPYSDSFYDSDSEA